MKTLELKTIFTIFESADELPETVKQLMHKAIAARQKAYAPYSKFNVGAALLLENDKIVTGNNQENAAYPAGLCAERVAIYYAGAKFPDKKIKILAISAAPDKHTVNTSIPPCGACRQALAEYEIKQNSPIAIYFMGKTGSIIKADSLKDMLPFIFEKSLLI